jgi:hypothetical protein
MVAIGLFQQSGGADTVGTSSSPANSIRRSGLADTEFSNPPAAAGVSVSTRQFKTRLRRSGRSPKQNPLRSETSGLDGPSSLPRANPAERASALDMLDNAGRAIGNELRPAVFTLNRNHVGSTIP